MHENALPILGLLDNLTRCERSFRRLLSGAPFMPLTLAFLRMLAKLFLFASHTFDSAPCHFALFSVPRVAAHL